MLSLPSVATVVLSHGISVHTKRNTSMWSVLCHTSRAFLRAPGPVSRSFTVGTLCKSDWKATVEGINLYRHLLLSNIMWGCFGELEITGVDWFKVLVGHNSMGGRITIMSFHDHIQTVLHKGVLIYTGRLCCKKHCWVTSQSLLTTRKVLLKLHRITESFRLLRPLSPTVNTTLLLHH